MKEIHHFRLLVGDRFQDLEFCLSPIFEVFEKIRSRIIDDQIHSGM